MAKYRPIDHSALARLRREAKGSPEQIMEISLAYWDKPGTADRPAGSDCFDWAKKKLAAFPNCFAIKLELRCYHAEGFADNSRQSRQWKSSELLAFYPEMDADSYKAIRSLEKLIWERRAMFGFSCGD